MVEKYFLTEYLFLVTWHYFRGNHDFQWKASSEWLLRDSGFKKACILCLSFLVLALIFFCFAIATFSSAKVTRSYSWIKHFHFHIHDLQMVYHGNITKHLILYFHGCIDKNICWLRLIFKHGEINKNNGFH